MKLDEAVNSLSSAICIQSLNSRFLSLYHVVQDGF